MAFGTMVETMAFVLGQKRCWYERRDLSFCGEVGWLQRLVCPLD